MSNKDVTKKPSETALFAALYRVIANKELKSKGVNTDYLAECFLPAMLKFLFKFRMIRNNFKRKSQKITPGIYEYVIARTAFFDNVFSEALSAEIPQIVFLGAGYDTRSYRFSHLNQATKIFELDVVTTQNRKKKCLEKMKMDTPKNITFVSIDFNRESLISVLESAGFNASKKTLFIWEGVSYYLEPEAVDATLEFVRNSSGSDSIIAFDYAVSPSQETINHYYGAKEFIETWEKKRSSEPFRFTIEEGAIDSFLDQRGLKVEKHFKSDEIEKVFLLQEAGLLEGRINGLFQFAVVLSK